jgi:hypothetical protein
LNFRRILIAPGRWLNMQLSAAWISKATDGHDLPGERSRIVRSGSAAAWAMRVPSVKRPDGMRDLFAGARRTRLRRVYTKTASAFNT